MVSFHHNTVPICISMYSRRLIPLTDENLKITRHSTEYLKKDHFNLTQYISCDLLIDKSNGIRRKEELELESLLNRCYVAMFIF